MGRDRRQATGHLICAAFAARHSHLIWWRTDDRKLSVAQRGALEKTIKRMEVVGVSAMTLVEVGILLAENRLRTKIAIAEFFAVLENNPAFQLMPVSYGVAAEAGAFIALRDPADRVIAATARVHRMTLLTADERLAGSGLVNCLT